MELLEDCNVSDEMGVLDEEFVLLDVLDEIVEDELLDLSVFDFSDEDDFAFFELSDELGVFSSELDEMLANSSSFAEVESVQAVSAIDKIAEVPNVAIFA